jgi:predicted SAM-dependent methyltransferase
VIDTLRKVYHWCIRIIQWQKIVFSNLNKPLPVYVKTASKGLKLHIGAGDINVQGWVNIDGRKFEHTHLVTEGFDLAEFSDNSIEEIYLCHVLEHFSFVEGVNLLKHFKHKMMTGGVLRVSVPDFDSLVIAYNANDNNIESIKYALMGGQDYIYNYHKAVFNRKSLASMLVESGFSESHQWSTIEDFGSDLGDWSSSIISIGEKELPISLNLKAVKV